MVKFNRKRSKTIKQHRNPIGQTLPNPAKHGQALPNPSKPAQTQPNPAKPGPTSANKPQTGVMDWCCCLRVGLVPRGLAKVGAIDHSAFFVACPPQAAVLQLRAASSMTSPEAKAPSGLPSRRSLPTASPTTLSPAFKGTLLCPHVQPKPMADRAEVSKRLQN